MAIDDELIQTLLEQARELRRRTDEITSSKTRMHDHIRARLRWNDPPSLPSAPRLRGAGVRPAPGDGGEFRYHGVGIEHLAFEVDRRDEVDDTYGRCVSAGGRIQSPPEQHYVEDGENYYAFFAFDPDGIRIEVFSWLSSRYRA